MFHGTVSSADQCVRYPPPYCTRCRFRHPLLLDAPASRPALRSFRHVAQQGCLLTAPRLRLPFPSGGPLRSRRCPPAAGRRSRARSASWRRGDRSQQPPPRATHKLPPSAPPPRKAPRPVLRLRSAGRAGHVQPARPADPAQLRGAGPAWECRGVRVRARAAGAAPCGRASAYKGRSLHLSLALRAGGCPHRHPPPRPTFRPNSPSARHPAQPPSAAAAPSFRTNWTRLVPPSVLTGHVSSLLPDPV